MMQALVIKTYGDPEMCGAIVDGMTRNVVALDDGELAAVKAECDRLRAKEDIRAYGDGIRFETACKALAVKYQPEPHGRLYWAVMRVWAAVWLGLYTVYDMLGVITEG